jgi:chromosome segregation ATPase
MVGDLHLYKSRLSQYETKLESDTLLINTMEKKQISSKQYNHDMYADEMKRLIRSQMDSYIFEMKTEMQEMLNNHFKDFKQDTKVHEELSKLKLNLEENKNKVALLSRGIEANKSFEQRLLDLEESVKNNLSELNRKVNDSDLYNVEVKVQSNAIKLNNFENRINLLEGEQRNSFDLDLKINGVKNKTDELCTLLDDLSNQMQKLSGNLQTQTSKVTHLETKHDSSLNEFNNFKSLIDSIDEKIRDISISQVTSTTTSHNLSLQINEIKNDFINLETLVKTSVNNTEKKNTQNELLLNNLQEEIENVIKPSLVGLDRKGIDTQSELLLKNLQEEVEKLIKPSLVGLDKRSNDNESLLYSLQEELENTIDKLKALKTETSESKQVKLEFKEFETKLLNYDTEIFELKQSNTIILRKTEEIDELKETHNSLLSQAKDIHDLKTQHEEDKNILNINFENISTQINEINTNMTELDCFVKSSLENIENKNKQNDQIINKLKEEFGKSIEVIKSPRIENSKEVEKEPLKELEKKTYNNTAQIKELQQIIQRELVDIKSDYGRFEESISKHETRLSEFQIRADDIMTFKSKLNDFDGRLFTTEVEINNLQQSLQHVLNLKSDLIEVQSKLDNHENEINDLHDKNEELLTKLSVSMEAKETLKNRLSDINKFQELKDTQIEESKKLEEVIEFQESIKTCLKAYDENFEAISENYETLRGNIEHLLTWQEEITKTKEKLDMSNSKKEQKSESESESSESKSDSHSVEEVDEVQVIEPIKTVEETKEQEAHNNDNDNAEENESKASADHSNTSIIIATNPSGLVNNSYYSQAVLKGNIYQKIDTNFQLFDEEVNELQSVNNKLQDLTEKPISIDNEKFKKNLQYITTEPMDYPSVKSELQGYLNKYNNLDKGYGTVIEIEMDGQQKHDDDDDKSNNESPKRFLDKEKDNDLICCSIEEIGLDDDDSMDYNKYCDLLP